MEWLSPLTALYAAAATVPILVLLYFLKLKRTEQVVSSTLLWKRAVQDLQVNAPFQKIRRNILLLLQLLMLLAIVLALGGPVLSLTAGAAQRYVLLIDRSASMNAADIRPSRLKVAKEQARTFVESLRSRAFFSIADNADQAMVIAFDDHAKVMCNFTSDKGQLLAAIDSIRPTDAGSSLAEAVVVARAFTQSLSDEAANLSSGKSARLVLFSDGRIRDTDKISVTSDELTFNCVGQAGQNLAITAMQARRSYEDPEQVNVFATLSNYGAEQLTCDVQLSINGNVYTVRPVTVPGCETSDSPDAVRTGKVSIDFSLTHPDAGILQVRQLHVDALGADDAAWTVLSAPRKLSVLLVTGGNLVLESALKACPLARLDTISPKEFDAMDHVALVAEQPYDVIVLDNCVPVNLPRGRYLVFGRPPAAADIEVPEQLENQVIVDWHARHPVLQHVSLTNLFAGKCYKMSLPRDAEVLAEFNESPALAVVRRNASVFVVAGFDVLQSNWPFEPGFVVFCYNATAFLGTGAGQGRGDQLKVGQPIIVDGLAAGTVAKISGPGFSGEEIKAGSGGSLRFPGSERVGVYSLEVPGQRRKFFAVNMLDSDESNIEPLKEIVLSGQAVDARQGPLSRANMPLWPWLVGVALVVACVEWLVYNSKVRIG